LIERIARAAAGILIDRRNGEGNAALRQGL